jgi:undecaprenyl-diphosphatase
MWHLTNDSQGFFSSAFGFVAQNPEWALLVAFLAAIIEAVAIVGTFLPGTVIVMGVAGAAAATGQPMFPFLVAAALGAVIGDFMSYWIGYRYRFVVRQWWPLAQRPQLMAGADRFFARYGAYGVALCRFSPVLRSTVPLVAGITGMPWARFLVANVISALLWAAVHIWPAQIAGMSIDRLRGGDWETAVLLGAGMLLCGLGCWALHRRLAPSMPEPRR